MQSLKTIGKIPPQALDLEQAILGAVIINSNAIDEVVMIIKSAEVFYKTEHAIIFSVIKHLSLANQKIDLLTISAQLKADGKLDQVGGDFYLIELSQKVSSAAHIEQHCRLVLEQWVKREAIKIGGKQVDNAYKDTVDVFELLAAAETGIDKINTMLDTGARKIDFKAVLQKVVDRVEMLTKMEATEIAGITTGFLTLDKFTGGWQNGDLVIVAARPGMGKTSLILRNMSEIAKRKIPVGIFSLEMSAEQLAARLVAINSNFHLAQLIKKGFEKDKYFTHLLEVQNEMNSMPIYIDDNASTTMQQLKLKARLWKRKHGIQALFVDYIQLMSGETKYGNREQEISTISRGLKQLAKELEIPVIALSQLSRAVETRGGDKRPRLADLRESGAIEQDADTVIFIYRPDYYGLECEPDMEAIGANTEISFAKYRAGSLETKGLWWQGDKTKFMDASEKHNGSGDVPF